MLPSGIFSHCCSVTLVSIMRPSVIFITTGSAENFRGHSMSVVTLNRTKAASTCVLQSEHLLSKVNIRLLHCTRISLSDV